MPPARCTSSMWYSEEGATLHKVGHMARHAVDVPHGEAHFRFLRGGASRCSTVLVEPPMAMSSVMAFSNASNEAMERGSTPASSCS